LDLILVSIAVFVFISLFNTKAGVSYFLLIFCSLVVLAVTAYWHLYGLHLFSQIVLAGLVVGIPVYFHESWTNLFSRRSIANQLPERQETYLSRAGLVFISIIIALVFVLINNGLPTKVGQYPEEVPLTAVNLGTGMSANFGESSTVRVVISAPLSAWRSISRDNFSAVVDGENHSEGTYDLPITVNSRSSDVKVIRIKPERVATSIEPVIVKTVPLVARYSGKAGGELVPDEATFEPEKVEISGAKSLVEGITQALVEIKLNGETQSIETKATPVFRTASDSLIGSVSCSPKEVSVKIPLVKAGKLKTVGIKAVLAGQPAAGYWAKTVTVTPAVISITGRADLLEEVESISTSAFSIEGINTTAQGEASLDFPTGITASENVTKVTLKVELDSTNTSRTITPEIQYEGLSSSLKVTLLSPASISVIISGSATVLATADSAVKINLDLSAYKSAGNYAVSISNADIALPSGISLVSYLPSAIDVKLENK